MKILEFPVRNYQFTIVVFVMLVALGVTSWRNIPRAEDPPLDFPSYTVVAVYPGATPRDLERLVARPIEDRLNGLDRVQSIESSLRDGVAIVVVEFDEREDADDKYDEVLREMNAVRPELPQEIADLTVEKASTLDVAIAQLALVSATASYRELDALAERLEDRLAGVPGVRDVARWGIPERQVDVSLDLGRMARIELPPALVLAAIAGESADMPAGSVEAGPRRFNVLGSGSYEDVDDVRKTVVRTRDGALVRVGDVADVRWSYADSTYRARYDGVRAAFVTVTQQRGWRVGDVRDRLWTELDRFEASLPAGITLERGFDQSVNVSRRLGRLTKDFMIAIGLVSITLMPLGLRAAGIVMLSIPLSLAIGVTVLYWTGFTINQLSIVGAVIALGLLVDDSIVVVENITRFLRAGYTRAEAAIAATRQIAIAVVGATATLVFAFVPLLFLPGGAGDYIRSLPLTVVYTVLASLFVSLAIIPWLASQVLRKDEPEDGTPVFRIFESFIRRTYAPLLDRALARPRITLALSGLFIVASVTLVPRVGFSLFPKAETPQFLIDVTAPQGASIEATDDAARFAEQVVVGRPGVQAVFTSVGHDNPRVYYNVRSRQDDPTVGQLLVVLDEYHHRRTPFELDSMRAELARYPAARLELREFENGPPIDAPIALRIKGQDLDTLRVLAGDVESVLRSVQGTRYVNNPVRVMKTDLRVAIDRDRAGLLDVPVLEVDRTLRLGLSGLQAGTLRDSGGDARPIVVRMASAGRAAPELLDRVQVASTRGMLAPLGSVASVAFETDVPEIQRIDRERTVTVTSFVETGYVTDRVTRRVLSGLETLELPEGYRIVPAGEIESRQESFGGVGGAVIVAMFMILAILVLEFGTFRSMLIVASVIPLGAAGGILALWITGYTLSFTAMIGFVALIGIEIKTSILLVDLANQMRRDGAPLDEAIRTAGEVRFLPIVLTALTAIGGLSPLAIQGEALYAPLAWVIIGGLVSSTLLGRVVTPVLYRLMPPRVKVDRERSRSHFGKSSYEYGNTLRVGRCGSSPGKP